MHAAELTHDTHASHTAKMQGVSAPEPSTLGGSYEAPIGDVPSLEEGVNAPTPEQVWGPFYVMGAPYRAKLSPPGAQGRLLVVRGRVFGLDTRKPVPYVTIDLWQASPDASYDYAEPDGVPVPYKNEINTHGIASPEYDYRCRMVTDHRGEYVFETLMPPPYFDPDDSTWRCPHIHYFVQHPHYEPVVTQIYFEGEERNDTDAHILPECTLKLSKVTQKDNDEVVLYETATFDVVLRKKEGEQ